MSQRKEISARLNKKSGVYCWVNKVNGNKYVGSSTNIYKRLSDYFKASYYLRCKNLVIAKAIIKYGLINFALIILEIVHPDDTITAEQSWMDKLKPEYNVAKIAANNSGFQHTPEAKEKISASGLSYWKKL